jgi:hypothetical protein
MNEEVKFVEDPGGGYTAWFIEIPNVITEGETKEEAYHNLILAIHDIVKVASNAMGSKKMVRKGYVEAMNGNELWINTETDERITIVVKDQKLRWDLYCNRVKVIIEVIDENEEIKK